MKEALKLALDALEYWDVHGRLHQPTEEAIDAIKTALAQPPQRTWVGLTDEEITKIFQRNGTPNGFARAIEKALKEKNT